MCVGRFSVVEILLIIIHPSALSALSALLIILIVLGVSSLLLTAVILSVISTTRLIVEWIFILLVVALILCRNTDLQKIITRIDHI